MKFVPSFGWLRRLCATSDGVSAIEFGLIAPILVLLVIGLIDFGMGFWDQMRVSDAAAAGAEYAFVHGWDSTAIANAVTSATNLTEISASPAPTEFCGCPNVAYGIVQTGLPPCSSTCPDGTPVGTYALVSAQAPYTPVLPFPGVDGAMTLASSSLARMK